MKDLRKRALFSLIFLAVCCIVLFSPLIATVASGNSTTWSDWQNKGMVSVSENAGEDRLNEPVEFTAKLDAAKSDGSDIRIIDSNDQEVPYQIDNASADKTFTIVFFTDVPRLSSKNYYILYNNPLALKPDYGQIASTVDNTAKTWQTRGVFIKWGEKAGFNVSGKNCITTLKFDNNSDNNPTNDPDCINDAYCWDWFYGFLGPDANGSNPGDFGSAQAQIVKNGPLFSEMALGTARLRYYKDHKWVLGNGYVQTFVGFDRNFQYMKSGLGAEAYITDLGSGDLRTWQTDYSSTTVNPQYLAFRNPGNGLVFGAIASNVTQWTLSAKNSGAWDRCIYFNDNANRPNAKIYWYSDTSNGYNNIGQLSKQLLNPISSSISVDIIPPTVWATPAGGIYNTSQQVTLTASEPASIYYTTDGTTPTASSVQYIGLPINILAPTTFKFMAIDTAGNQSQVYTENYVIDTDPPLVSLNLCGALGDNGWFVSDANFCISATDTVSGVASREYSLNSGAWTQMTAPVTISNEGTTTICYRATDNAGNTSTPNSHDVKIDKTAPTTTVSLEGTLGNNGWYTSDVTVTLTAVDNVSGVARTEYSFDNATWTTYAAPFVISTEGTTTVYYRSIDNAGNVESYQEQPIIDDKTAPLVDAAPVGGTPGGGGYYTTPPQIEITPGSDGSGSGYDHTEYSWDCSNWFTYSGPVLVTEDGTKICYYRSVDKAGNIGPVKSIVIKIDKTKPTTSISLQGTLGQNGWYTSDVVVTLTAEDTTSGVAKTEYSFDNITWATYTAPFTISTEGTTTAYYRSVDNAGNTEDVQGPEIVKIDKTQPQITITTPADGAEYLLNQLVLANWAVLDPFSGVFSSIGTVPSGNPIDTASVGIKYFSVSAQDFAGNKSTNSATYYVRYSYIGILQPINQDGSSVFRMGNNRTIPVKFQLQDANGNYISTAVARIYLTQISSNIMGTELEGISTSAATEGNLFRYDSTDNLYIFNLATDNLSAGTWRLRVELDDGTSKYVNISLK